MIYQSMVLHRQREVKCLNLRQLDFVNLDRNLTSVSSQHGSSPCNVHVCCQGRPLVAEFCNILESFGFMQNITGPMHVHGHTLDLILSYRTAVYNVNLEDVSFSDHNLIIFNAHVM